MRRMSKHRFGAVAVFATLALAACEPAEERAQSHYQRAASLLEAGDTERAALEFRNALQADPEHAPSLRAYAAMLRDGGDLAGAAREYTRLATIEPEDAGVQLALAKLALEMQDFSAVEAHAARAYELAPDSASARAMGATVAFRSGQRHEALELARNALAEEPANVAAHMVMIADRLADSDHEGAVTLADAALQEVPNESDLHLAKLTALEQLGDPEAVREQLETMNALFPENGMVLQALMQWYIEHDRSDDAIGIMREIAEKNPEDPAGYLDVVRTILSTRGAEAARAELEALVGSKAEALPYRVALAKLDYAEGRRDEAIAALEALVQGEETSPTLRDVQIDLATMLQSVDRAEEARRIAEAVLAADGRHVGALKMRARWLIDEDRTEEAMADLKAASMEAPRDPEVMTVMASAHEREGAVELVGERLARAVEASGFGTAESLRYAVYLIREERFPQAEGVVLDALRRDPENRDLLVALGQIHLRRDDPARVRQVAGLLRGLGTPEAAEAATSLDLAALGAEGRTEETVALLETVAGRDGADMRARAGLVQARVAAGDLAGARAEIDAILAEDPASVPGRLMLAALHAHEGRAAEAEPIYRAVIEDHPDLVESYRRLFTLLNGFGRATEAVAVLERGIEASGRNSALLDLRAGRHYADGEHERAITLYEELYARNSFDVVTANNLASLLSMHREDSESLDRAFAVARRLRGTDVPHFQDTYGWILVRRGDHQQALTYLEPAAAAIPKDAMVQYHLGMAYHGLERWDEARAALSRAVELGPDLSQSAAARVRIEEIDARPAETPAEG